MPNTAQPGLPEPAGAALAAEANGEPDSEGVFELREAVVPVDAATAPAKDRPFSLLADDGLDDLPAAPDGALTSLAARSFPETDRVGATSPSPVSGTKGGALGAPAGVGVGWQ